MAGIVRENHSLKERYNYHKRLANTGKDLNGKSLTTAQRVYHANRAEELRKENDIFMNGVEFGKKIACNGKKTSKGK